MKDEITILCNESYGCGWYIHRPNGYLHKDLIWRSSTGFSSSSCYRFGAAPGYYATRTQAEIMLQTYLQIERGQNMKVGDRVIARDLSYAKAVEDGKLVGCQRGLYKDLGATPAIVVAMNCKLPNESYQQNHLNDTIVQVISTNEIVFIHGGFLQPVVRNITIDGQIVELSEQSYQNLKKQFIN